MGNMLQAGWYADPMGHPNQLRYWDGQNWTSMTRMEDINDIASATSFAKMPSDATISLSKAALVIATAFVKLSIWIGAAFVVSIFPVTFTPLGQWAPFGTPLVAIASALAQWSVIGALISAAVAMPLIAMFKKVAYQEEGAAACQELAECLSTGEVTQSEYEEECRAVSMFLRIKSTQQNCAAVAYILAAGVAAFIAHDFLMDALGNPWADFVTLILIPIVYIVIGLVLNSISMKKYEKEDGILYRELNS